MSFPALTSFATIDWVVILGYFVVTTAIGLAAARRVGDADGYFLGHRAFGRALMVAQSFGIGTHAEQPVSLAGAVYKSGFAAIWYQWKNMFATPFYWVMAPVYRRCRRTTIAQVIEDRYGAGVAGCYTVFALVFFILNMGAMLKGAVKVIGIAGGGSYSANQIIAGMTATFILYSFVGGLIASAWTNVFQCFLQLVLSFLLIPLGWGLVGGMGGMKRVIDDPSFFTLSTPGDVGVFLILMLTLNGLIGIMAMPHMLATVGTGKTESACRIGFAYGNFIKRLCTIGWAVVGLIVLALALSGELTPQQQAELARDSEHAFGVACQRLLAPGLLGLLIASILADNMSAASAFMVDSGALFTRGFYDRFVAPGRTDRHYLWAGRISGLAITLLGVLYAMFFVDRVLYSFLLTETLASYFGISLLGGLIWRRANRWGAMASLAVSLAVNFGWYALNDLRLDAFRPEAFALALVSGGAALVVVSLLTAPEGERARELFDRLDTPVGSEDLSPAMARTRAADAGEQLLLPNLLRLRAAASGRPFLTAYRTDLRGFALAWCVVAAMISLAWLLLQAA
jgi:Na+/proline symporter